MEADANSRSKATTVHDEAWRLLHGRKYGLCRLIFMVRESYSGMSRDYVA